MGKSVNKVLDISHLKYVVFYNIVAWIKEIYINKSFVLEKFYIRIVTITDVAIQSRGHFYTLNGAKGSLCIIWSKDLLLGKNVQIGQLLFLNPIFWCKIIWHYVSNMTLYFFSLHWHIKNLKLKKSLQVLLHNQMEFYVVKKHFLC